MQAGSGGWTLEAALGQESTGRGNCESRGLEVRNRVQSGFRESKAYRLAMAGEVKQGGGKMGSCSG